MRRETLSPVLRGPLLTLALLSLTSCLTPESVDCPSGLVCPAGQKCAAHQDVCIKTDCGDGIVQLGETCDDGNIQDGDGCNRTCSSDEACGNGVVDVISTGSGTRREACDDGNNVDGDGCSADCLSSELCGNGVVDRAGGEVCDDGNKLDNDGCSADCVSNEKCGNGIVDHAVGEVCDDGNIVSGDNCSSDCRSGEKCGNGIRDADEQCDDGNASDTDNCLPITCVLATCGDGKVDQENPRLEECDTGGESATCNLNCTLVECGDGIVNVHAEEECEDGNTSDTDDCTHLCKKARCGDGYVQAGVEECDDNNTSNTDGCTSACRIARCGDGYVQAGIEECEPGLHPACNPTCRWNICGDGIVNTSAGHEEVCDDGNDDSCGTCSSDCKKAQAVSRATGRIIGVPAENIHGETFTFKSPDGELVFEFDKDGKVDDGHIRVNIDGLKESDEVAIAIKKAIYNQDSNPRLEWRVSSLSWWNIVMLEYKTEGWIGYDRSITEDVGVGGFSAEILTRGFGYDCSSGKGCMRDQDCKSRHCTIPAGKVTGTCD